MLEHQRVRRALRPATSGKDRRITESASGRHRATEEDVFVEDYADEDVDDDYQPGYPASKGGQSRKQDKDSAFFAEVMDCTAKVDVAFA
ncbi:hypothetical protein K4K59_012093 [Colletotrichum sp. SAR11_240]|nr:hypothetical protein K4K59_012093 [Colletotrichum sp. SAR11_240]